MKKQVTVVIPIHLEEPSEFEKVSLAQILSILHKHPITFQTKEGLNTKWYEEFCRGKATVSFERFRWNGLDEYAALMFNPDFYRRFTDYEYILLCHLDAFVFRDELDKWCQYGYDYIGSVIYNTEWENMPTRLGKLLGLVKPEYFSNGGFALRKVESYIYLLSLYSIKIRLFIWKLRHSFYQEDVFLCQLFPKLSSTFKIPPKSLAQQFGVAFEVWDEKKLPFGNDDCNILPFGTHGWFNHHPNFWKPCIRAYGHNV